MCLMCDGSGYIPEQRESTGYGGVIIVYDVLVECQCKAINAAQLKQIPGQRRITESWNTKRKRNWWDD